MQAIMTVFAFPPKESFKRRVSLLSLKGIWGWLPFLLFYTKALIQFPRDNKLLFILVP